MRKDGGLTWRSTIVFITKTLDELKEDMTKMGLDIPVSADAAVLFRPIDIGKKTVPNRLAINPMEGCDGTPEGKPSDLTRRRYRRFRRGWGRPRLV